MAEPVIHAPVRAQADLVPVRMCNELVYCARLFHLEHVQGIFIESADTVEGAAQHRRAARRGRVRNAPEPCPDGAELPEGRLRTLSLTSESWGVTGKVDLVEFDGDTVVAVEAKRGRAPKSSDHRWGDHALPYRLWPADTAQLGLYMAMLRELGLECDEGRVLYRESKLTTKLPWSRELELFLRDVVTEARRLSTLPCAPDPLVDSPKCRGCSLHEACLPDEHAALRAIDRAKRPPSGEVRRIVAGRDDRAVVHVVTPGAMVRKDGESLALCTPDGNRDRVPIKDVAHVALFGPTQVTEPCLRHLLRCGIPISHHTGAGRLVGVTSPIATLNVGLRRAQYRCADDDERCLEAARAFVLAKIRNQRTVLKRYRRGLRATLSEELGSELPAWAGGADPDEQSETDSAVSATTEALKRMSQAIRGASRSLSIDVLRGHEGDAGACYFEAFPAILPTRWRGDFSQRSRRPPRDRVNSLLSFGYALLVREATAALSRIGLDPMLGLYHSMIPGRPALALDLMEPFRAAWVDTAMLRLLATGGIEREDFHVSAEGVYLSDRGRRATIAAYERRGDELTTHPRFGYRMSYRRIVELEARVLAKWLVGEIDELRPMWTR